MESGGQASGGKKLPLDKEIAREKENACCDL
jgi:hypothetical protein